MTPQKVPGAPHPAWWRTDRVHAAVDEWYRDKAYSSPEKINADLSGFSLTLPEIRLNFDYGSVSEHGRREREGAVSTRGPDAPRKSEPLCRAGTSGWRGTYFI